MSTTKPVRKQMATPKMQHDAVTLVLPYIEKYQKDHSNLMTPSVRTIGAKFKKSSTWAHYCVNFLETEGYIKKIRKDYFQIKIV